jgi:hypothetical protein
VADVAIGHKSDLDKPFQHAQLSTRIYISLRIDSTVYFPNNNGRYCIFGDCLYTVRSLGYIKGDILFEERYKHGI